LAAERAMLNIVMQISACNTRLSEIEQGKLIY